MGTQPRQVSSQSTACIMARPTPPGITLLALALLLIVFTYYTGLIVTIHLLQHHTN